MKITKRRSCKMSQIKVNSEIGKLKVVLLHEPGEELHNLTPKKLDDLLFDDIPWLPLAKKEHQAFAKTFIDAGVKVVYLVDLMKEVLDLSNDQYSITIVIRIDVQTWEITTNC